MSYIPTQLVKTIFDKEAERVLNDKWLNFRDIQRPLLSMLPPNWEAVFPYPDFSALPRYPALRIAGGPHYPTEHEQRLQWQMWAKDFIARYNKYIDDRHERMEEYLHNELNAWNRNHLEKNEQLELTRVFQDWAKTLENLSLRELSELNITKATVTNFVKPKFDYLIEKYGMRTENSPAPTTQPKKVSVFINNDFRSSLIESIGSYIDSDDLDRLKDLVNGRPIDGRVTVHCKQNVLGKIFYIAYENGCTSASKAAFRDWICQSFEKELKGVVLPLTDSTMYSHLNGLYLSKK